MAPADRIAFCLCCVALLALAGFEQAAAQTARATVRLDGAQVLVVTGDTRSQARARADEIERRLNRILEAAAPTTDVVVASKVDGNRALSVAGRTIVLATADDAADAGRTLDALALQWQRAIEAALAEASERRVTPWGRFVAQTRASINNAFARLYESAILVIPRLIAGALVLLLFWALAALVRWLMRILFRRIISDLTVENLIRQVAYYSVWAIGVIVATSALGFDPQALATGLGLTGVALGFALKDILSNFVAGLLILGMRPFEIGDQIVVGETEGAVEGINLRATRIRTYDGRAVLVPNAEVFTSRITNNTESPVRRGSIEVPVDYRTDLISLGAMLIEEVRGVEGVLPDPPPNLRVQNLGRDDIIVEIRFWTDSRRSDFVATASHVRERVVSTMRHANIDLPDPSLRVVARQADSNDAQAR